MNRQYKSAKPNFSLEMTGLHKSDNGLDRGLALFSSQNWGNLVMVRQIDGLEAKVNALLTCLSPLLRLHLHHSCLDTPFEFTQSWPPRSL